MRARNADLKMSQTTVTRKKQEIVDIWQRLAARLGIQVKPGETHRNLWGAPYAAVNVFPLGLFSIRRRSPRDQLGN